MIATNDSSSMRAVADHRRVASPARSSFGVVPDEISEWKPEIAPQAIVMKQNGKTLPAKIGPVPSTKRVSGRQLRSSGRSDDDAERQQRDRADLDERREVVARREQQPDRQHRGGEAVGDDRPRERRRR